MTAPPTTSPRDAILRSVQAELVGTATAKQAELVAAVIDAAVELIGPLVKVMDAPFEELNELQRRLREQFAAADAARKSPPLTDMQAVFDMLVSTEQHSGATLKLAPGANVFALDDNQRRYLAPTVSYDTLSAIRKAKTLKDAARCARKANGVRYTWSRFDPAGLMPDIAELAEQLPLPDGGCYLVVYQARLEVAAKGLFLAAATKLAAGVPVADILFWDTHGATPTLWTLAGSFGHAGTGDLDLPPDIHTATSSLRAHLAGADS